MANFVTVDGQTVILSPEEQVISDQGEDITNTPRGRNLIAKAKSGYTEEQAAATEQRQARNREAFISGIMTIAEFLPGIGDAIAAYDTVEAFIEEDYVTAGILGVALAAGLIPGVGDAIAAPLKAAAKRIPTADIVGITRALRDRDIEFLKSYRGAEYAGSVGARAAATKSYKIINADGSEEVFTGTWKEFKEAYGASQGSRKNKRGSLPQGGKWAEEGTDVSTYGTKKAEVEFVDPASVTFKSVGEGAVRLPRALTQAQRDTIRKEIDENILTHFQRNVDQVQTPDNVVFDPVVGFEVEHLDDTLTISNAMNKEFAREVAEEAWPDIVQTLEKYKELGAEQYNAILKFAKQRSQYIFSFRKDAKIKDQSGLRKAMRQSGGVLSVPEQVTHNPGILERLGKYTRDTRSTEVRKLDEATRTYNDLVRTGIIKEGATSTPRPARKNLILDSSTSLPTSSIQAPTRRPMGR